MSKNSDRKAENNISWMQENIDRTDIRVLVFAPPIVGFGSLLVWLMVTVWLTGGGVDPALYYIVIGIASMVTSLSGFFEIYKKEMPGAFGQILKGKIAIISGILMILLFGALGGILIIFGIIEYFSSIWVN